MPLPVRPVSRRRQWRRRRAWSRHHPLAASGRRPASRLGEGLQGGTRPQPHRSTAGGAGAEARCRRRRRRAAGAWVAGQGAWRWEERFVAITVACRNGTGLAQGGQCGRSQHGGAQRPCAAAPGPALLDRSPIVTMAPKRKAKPADRRVWHTAGGRWACTGLGTRR